MAAGPRDTPHGRDTAADSGAAREPREGRVPESRGPRESMDAMESEDPGDRLEPLEPGEPLGSLESLESLDPLGRLEPLGSAEELPPIEDGESFRELRPARRLRIWQLAPITALAVGGSLMFAFPLAFESGDAGPVVAMLGLLLCCCAAGWGLMAARRLGQTWPGLPSRGSGARPDWRFVAGYAVLIALVAVLAVWRVARLR
ncbi:hypothetical protein VSR01_30315 [Actinacidiphila sp. DG2A-62]|uniref:hypothetical protein n=1 Tax=Actinacidiphila sp. DG2A-62 TaxID=3108821 RepID=UPI002DBFCDF2|nr:hypothetical protein [Actinacidiphila sp. DG2A-62]MEC3997555.1 hypothetical protein [Actinacidiphila sp. DG2A-62]